MRRGGLDGKDGNGQGDGDASLEKCLRAGTERETGFWDPVYVLCKIQYMRISFLIPGEGDAFRAARLSGSV